MDFELLEKELRFFLNYVLKGNFYQQFHVDENNRVIKDIAISGNGEPTSLKEFDRAVALVGHIAIDMGVLPRSQFVLITNGSLLHRLAVRNGLKILNEFAGEVWFKFDSATEQGRRLINGAGQGLQLSINNLELSAQLCNTKLQICLVNYEGRGFPLTERKALLDFMEKINNGVRLNEVMLYTLERPSLQPEASRLSKLSADIMSEFADKIRELGFNVSVSL
jgi:wyosine [tRNA(Phe)-imidazoG37] synthetase (radical SAM superfamily)